MNIGLLLLGFIIGTTMCLGGAIIQSEGMSMTDALRYVGYFLLAILVLQSVGWFLRPFFGADEPGERAEVWKDPYDSGDRLNPDSVEQVGGHSFTVSTNKGRKFLVSRDRRGNAAFQEIYKDGSIGKPVVENFKVQAYGKTPVQGLMEALKDKVEKDRRRGD